MDSNDINNSDWEEWYQQNKDAIPDAYKADIESNIPMLQFLFRIYYKTMQDFVPVLRELMYIQYPVIKKEKRPLIVEYINKFINSVGSNMLFKLNSLLEGQKEGVNVREKYPKFDNWVKIYGKPQTPKLIDDTDRTKFKEMTDLEWEVYQQKENENLLKIFNWKEKRKFEFIERIQEILFKNFNELEGLNADEWIIYAVHVGDEYEYYKMLCEHIQLFIDCGFPEEDIRLNDEEFNDEFDKLDNRVKLRILELRSRRIDGENV